MKLASKKVRNRAMMKILVVAAIGMLAWMSLRTSTTIVFESRSPDAQYRCAIVTLSSLVSETKTQAVVYHADGKGGWNSTNERDFGDATKGSFVANWETDSGGATEGMTLKQLDGNKVVLIMSKRFVAARAESKPATTTGAGM